MQLPFGMGEGRLWVGAVSKLGPELQLCSDTHSAHVMPGIVYRFLV